MSSEKMDKLWLLATSLLIMIIIASSVLIWAYRNKSQPIVVYPPNTPTIEGEIYVYGAVVHPQIYTLREGETIAGLINASGGTDSDADLYRISLFIPPENKDTQPQKINLNRAEAWLLESLPNIGETRARAIVDYRQKNGIFRNTKEITFVPGISAAIFEKIKNYITVID